MREWQTVLKEEESEEEALSVTTLGERNKRLRQKNVRFYDCKI